MRNKIVSISALLVLMIAITGMSEAASTYVKVTANPIWTDTSLTVKQGQTINVGIESGQWTTGYEWCGPQGDTLTLNNDDLFLNRYASQHGQLIAFVGKDPYWGDYGYFPVPLGRGYWSIGKGAIFKSDRSGKLWLGINDAAASRLSGGAKDNQGYIMTVVRTG